jgi:hypothetical protein
MPLSPEIPGHVSLRAPETELTLHDKAMVQVV